MCFCWCRSTNTRSLEQPHNLIKTEQAQRKFLVRTRNILHEFCKNGESVVPPYILQVHDDLYGNSPRYALAPALVLSQKITGFGVEECSKILWGR